MESDEDNSDDNDYYFEDFCDSEESDDSNILEVATMPTKKKSGRGSAKTLSGRIAKKSCEHKRKTTSATKRKVGGISKTTTLTLNQPTAPSKRNSQPKAEDVV